MAAGEIKEKAKKKNTKQQSVLCLHRHTKDAEWSRTGNGVARERGGVQYFVALCRIDIYVRSKGGRDGTNERGLCCVPC